MTSFAYVDGKWSSDQRRVAWTLISMSRQGLYIDIDPAIATAFVLLQKYFRHCNTHYDLFILMNAALFSSCKQQDLFRPMYTVYGELFRICSVAPNAVVNSLVTEHVGEVPSHEDLELIAQAELDIISAGQYNFNIELPFSYLNMVAEMLALELPREALPTCQRQIMLNICLVIRSDDYLDIAPEVIAAAAIAQCLMNHEAHGPVYAWVVSVAQKYGETMYVAARDSIEFEKHGTVIR